MPLRAARTAAEAVIDEAEEEAAEEEVVDGRGAAQAGAGICWSLGAAGACMGAPGGDSGVVVCGDVRDSATGGGRKTC